MSEHQKLREQVDAHDAAYERGEPMIADHKYDEMVKRLGQVEMQLGMQPKLRKCGLAGRKVKHTEPFLGLQSTYDAQELEDWMRGIQDRHGKCTFGVGWKHDGVAVRLKYARKDGANPDSPLDLVSAVTRGDGDIGSDVSQYVNNSQKNGWYCSSATYEAMISLRDLEKVNEIRKAKCKPAFKNPRSAVVSAFNGACDEVVEYIWFVQHFGDFFSDSDPERILQQCCIASGSENIVCDGFVIFVEDRATRKTIGETGTYPKWAMAYKNDYYALESTITGIIDQRGQKRRIQFEPRSAGFRAYSTAVCPEWINPVVGAKCAISVRGGNPILAAVF